MCKASSSVSDQSNEREPISAIVFVSSGTLFSAALRRGGSSSLGLSLVVPSSKKDG